MCLGDEVMLDSLPYSVRGANKEKKLFSWDKNGRQTYLNSAFIVD
jgi:hypothetical protein